MDSNKEEDRNQVSSTTGSEESDDESTGSHLTTNSEEGFASVERTDSAGGLSDFSRERLNVGRMDTDSDTSSDSSDDTDGTWVTITVNTVGTQTDPADYGGDTLDMNFPHPSASSAGCVYDDKGIHILTGLDLCDCYVKDCPGCHLSCSNCGSCKCGLECRRNRKY